MADSNLVGVSEMAAVMDSSIPQKRRRGGSQADDRRSKRGAPAASMSTAPDIVAQDFLNHQAALEAAKAAAVAAAAAASDNSAIDVTAADFNALRQATEADLGDPHDHDHDHSTSVAAAALMYPTLHISHGVDPYHTPGGPDEDVKESDYPPPPDGTHQDPMLQASPMDPDQSYDNGLALLHDGRGPKPAVGTEEWHQKRKDNHKEVERRRRETINEGITELSKIVPNCEKNKGSILNRAIAYINQLKHDEVQSDHTRTLDKLLTEQALTEVTASNARLKLEYERLKQEYERLYGELETWKHVAVTAGLQPPMPKDDPSIQPTLESMSADPNTMGG